MPLRVCHWTRPRFMLVALGLGSQSAETTQKRSQVALRLQRACAALPISDQNFRLRILLFDTNTLLSAWAVFRYNSPASPTFLTSY